VQNCVEFHVSCVTEMAWFGVWYGSRTLRVRANHFYNDKVLIVNRVTLQFTDSDGNKTEESESMNWVGFRKGGVIFEKEDCTPFGRDRVKPTLRITVDYMLKDSVLYDHPERKPFAQKLASASKYLESASANMQAIAELTPRTQTSYELYSLSKKLIDKEIEERDKVKIQERDTVKTQERDTVKTEKHDEEVAEWQAYNDMILQAYGDEEETEEHDELDIWQFGDMFGGKEWKEKYDKEEKEKCDKEEKEKRDKEEKEKRDKEETEKRDKEETERQAYSDEIDGNALRFKAELPPVQWVSNW